MFKVIGTKTYLRELKKLDKIYKNIAKKVPLNLKENPYSGKPLNYAFLREKKIKEKRIYYIIYDDLKLILLVAISGKKDQQATINFIKKQLKNFRKIAEEISKQVP